MWLLFPAALAVFLLARSASSADTGGATYTDSKGRVWHVQTSKIEGPYNPLGIPLDSPTEKFTACRDDKGTLYCIQKLSYADMVAAVEAVP